MGLTHEEKRLQNRMLKRLGLPTHADPNGLLVLFGQAIQNHDDLRRFMQSVEERERHDFYVSIRPHLRFTPLPEDVYVAQIKQAAEAAQWPIMDKHGNLRAYQPFEMRTLHKVDIPIPESAERLCQAFKYFRRNLVADGPIFYKVHIIRVNGEARMQFTAGVYENGKPVRIQ